MDNHETRLTAWEELNGQPNASSAKYQAALAELAKAEADLAPCSLDRAIELLTPNLILCAPSGMSDDDRHEWYKAALMTIGDMPADLLQQACAAARRVCDHPAKIVPYICEHNHKISKPWQDAQWWRERMLREARAKLENIDAKRIGSKPFELPEDERRELSTDIGLLVKEMERKAILSAGS
jgi:hypothetical protein